jgi:hypothetical protein
MTQACNSNPEVCKSLKKLKLWCIAYICCNGQLGKAKYLNTTWDFLTWYSFHLSSKAFPTFIFKRQIKGKATMNFLLLSSFLCHPQHNIAGICLYYLEWQGVLLHRTEALFFHQDGNPQTGSGLHLFPSCLQCYRRYLHTEIQPVTDQSKNVTAGLEVGTSFEDD